jgi:Fe-S cluster assembly scaffold IscU|eukprot:40578_1
MLRLAMNSAAKKAFHPTSTSKLSAPAGVLMTTKRGYHENIVEHYENPRNVGSLDKNDDNVGTGLVGAPACGDVMKLQIKVDDDGNILESKFKTFGCGSAIASSSVATEWVKGKSVDEVLGIKNTDIAAHLKLPPVKLHCSMLAEDAIRAAVQDWKEKKEKKIVKE